MKKTVISSLAMSIFASVSMTTTGCSNPATPLDRMRDRINIINNNDGKIYLYKEYSEVLNEKLDNISTVESLDKINFKNDFTAIVFMVQHYEVMTKEFTQMLFGDFLKRSDNVMLIFLDFPDFNFLQWTTAFYDERGFYPANGFFKEFNNFQGRKTRSAGEVMGFDLPNPIIIEEQFIAAFAAGIMSYIWQH